MTCDEKRELLKGLSKHFRFRCHLKSFAILSARVPVVQLKDPTTGVNIPSLCPRLAPLPRHATPFPSPQRKPGAAHPSEHAGPAGSAVLPCRRRAAF